MSLNEKEIEFFFSALHIASSCYFSPKKDSTTTKSEDPVVRLLKHRQLESSLENFRMAATNVKTSAEDLQSAKSSLLHALDATNLLEPVVKMHESRMEMLDEQEQRKKNNKTSGSSSSYKDKNCYTQVEMQEVVRNLFIGSWHPAADENLLNKFGVTKICCCVNVTPRLAAKGFDCIVLPAEDDAKYDISQHFDASFDFIDDALSKRGTGVIVHCGAGISRAPTILAAYLIRKLKISADDAVGMIQKVRQVARPNNGFMQQLKNFERSHLLEK
jgi:hypothetical protein